jgi:protein gp37
MAERTNIHWADSTVNPTGGCDGCELQHGDVRKCYAAGLTRRFGRSNPGLANTFTELVTFPGRMAKAAEWSDLTGRTRPRKPWLGLRPRVIFISDMSDALCDAFDFNFLLEEIIGNVTSDPGRCHDWAWLTKRPARMAQFSAWLGDRGISWPGNLWAGTSVTTQQTTGRIEHLLQVGGADTPRFVSVEPAWGPIDLRPWLPRLNWLIHGGESGAGAEPFDIAWAEQMLAHCRQHRVPCFLKQFGARAVQNGQPVHFNDPKGGDWSEWPAHLQVREMPRSSEQNQTPGDD